MLLGKGSYSTLLPNLAVSKNFSQLFMTKSSVHLFQLSPDLGVSTSHSTSARKRTVRELAATPRTAIFASGRVEGGW